MKSKLLILLLFVISNLQLSAQGVLVLSGTNIEVAAGTTLRIETGDLTIKSDETGDASLIDFGTVAFTSGETKVERYLTNGTWHLISAPVAGIVAGQFPGDFLQRHTESTNLWTDINSLTYELVVAKGYALWSMETEPSTEVFAGTTNTGSQQFTFTKSGLGYNLVGNPYPSAIDWDMVTIPANLYGHFQLWNPTVGDYVYYIKGGGDANTTSKYIPSGQGFFVQATGSGTLDFGNTVRSHGTQLFYKDETDQCMLVLKVTGNELTTQTAIRFIEGATPQIDRLYDVQKIISGTPEIPNLYSYAENQKMAINTLPSFKDHETIPLAFDAGMDGIYTIQASELASIPEDVPVFLEDTKSNYLQDLRINPSYSFDYTLGVVREFKIHFKDVTGIESPETLNILCWLSDNILHVNFDDDDFGKAAISVYSITGQQILSRQTSLANNNIAFNGSQSVYLVYITTNEGNYSTKVFNQ